MIPTDESAQTIAAERAAQLGLPRVVWHGRPNLRVVAWHDDEDQQIHLSPERLEGFDLLGVARWARILPAQTWDDDLGEHRVPAAWMDLANALLESADFLSGPRDEGSSPREESPGASGRVRDALVAAYVEALIVAEDDETTEEARLRATGALQTMDRLAEALDLSDLAPDAFAALLRLSAD